jgi:diaminopimelate decarboxylase
MSESSRRVHYLDPFFRYKNSVFYVENVPYTTIVKRVGTPVIVFSEKRLLKNLESIREAFSKKWPKVKIAYPYKANYLLGIRRILKECNAYAEVMSGLELEMALEAKVEPKRIIFNGPGKTIEELEKAIELGIMCLNADSLSELQKISNIANKKGINVNVGIRVHPDMGEIADKAFIKQGSKMGFDISCEDAFRAFEYAKKLKKLNIVGINFHISSRSASPLLHEAALKSTVELMKNLKKQLQIELKYLDVGGGFETRSIMEREGTKISDFALNVQNILSELDYQPYLVIEPGRYLVNDCGIGIGKVTTKKQSAGNTWLITDIGTNVLIPTGNHEFQVVSAELKDNIEEANVGDGICSPSAVIEKKVQLSSISEDEYIVVLNCGAYTVSLFEDFGSTLPAIVFVNGDKFTFRKRQTIKQAMKNFR